MKLSVALCTYNGETYLPTQLESIANQTRVPDEIIIRDDCSKDRTVEIANEFAKTAPCKVCVLHDGVNVGSTLNFAKAIGACTGDIIFLSDQDDYWLPQKVERLEAALLANPSASFVASDAEMVDQQLNPLGYNLWQTVGLDSQESREALCGEHGLNLMLKRWYITGATMAFRSQFRDLILPVPKSWVHDAWIAFLLRAVSSLELVNEPLIRYRQHSTQQIGAKKLNLWNQIQVGLKHKQDFFEKTLAMFENARDRLREQNQYGVPSWVQESLDEKVDHATIRYNMRKTRFRAPAAISEFMKGRYNRYSLGWKAFLQDLFV